MKKNIITIIIAVAIINALFPVMANAQSTDQQSTGYPRLMIGFTGGISVPMGKLSGTNYADISGQTASGQANVNYNTGSGFTGLGGNGGITATYLFNKNWGIAEIFSYQRFSYAGGQNMAYGVQAFPGGFDVDSVTFSFKGTTQTFNILVGPVYSLELSKKIALDFRLLVGFVNASLAGNNITLTDGGVTDPTFYQAVSWANTFGTQLGVALRYNISDHVGLAVNADYFYSKPDFTVNNINRNNAAGREIYSYNEPFEGINGNLTVFYVLKHK